MNKNLICTVVHGKDYIMLGEVSHPTMQAYAERIGADFRVFPKKIENRTREIQSPAWLKLWAIWKMLDIYDRVMFVDSDAIIHPNCPDLFRVVPTDCFGAFFEGFCCDRWPSLKRALEFYSMKTDRQYSGEYFNSGVMVVGQHHRDIFKRPENGVVEDNFFEQGYINANLFVSGLPSFHLSYKFNRTILVDNLVGEDRRACHILHYAGIREKQFVRDDMRKILKLWEKEE